MVLALLKYVILFRIIALLPFPKASKRKISVNLSHKLISAPILSAAQAPLKGLSCIFPCPFVKYYRILFL